MYQKSMKNIFKYFLTTNCHSAIRPRKWILVHKRCNFYLLNCILGPKSVSKAGLSLHWGIWGSVLIVCFRAKYGCNKNMKKNFASSWMQSVSTYRFCVCALENNIYIDRRTWRGLLSSEAQSDRMTTRKDRLKNQKYLHKDGHKKGK